MRASHGPSVSGWWFSARLTRSLERLGIERFYGVLLHRPKQLSEPHGAEIYDALLRIQTRGQLKGEHEIRAAQKSTPCVLYAFDLLVRDDHESERFGLTFGDFVWLG